MHLIKIVYGNDKGGIFSCESQYLQLLKQKGIVVHLIIVGEGHNSAKYEGMINSVIRLKTVDVKFDGTGIKRLMTLVKAFVFGLKNALKIRYQFKSHNIASVIYRREAFMFLGGILAIGLKTKCYWHMANSINNRSSKLLHNSMCKIFGINPIANSKYTQKTFGPKCRYVVYPGFSTEKLSLSHDNDRFGLPIPKNALIYGMIARVCLEKAQDLLVEGFVSSHAAAEGCHLILAGNADRPEFLSDVKACAGALWGVQVHYIGLTNEVAKFYGLIDVAVNSRRNAEPFGISVAEAMYMKKPVISYYLGGPTEMIKEGENGWLVHGVSKQAYVDAFNLSFENRDEWRKMGETSFRLSSPFNSETNVDNLVEIIKSNLI